VTASPIQGSMTARTSAFTAPVLARGVASEGAIAAVDSVGGRLTRLYSEVSPSAVVGVAGIQGTAPSETALPLSSDVYGSGLVSSDLLTVTGSPEPSSTLGIASVVAPRAVLEVSVLGGNAATREVVSANIASAQGVPSVGTLRLAFSRRTTGGESKFLMDSSNENQFFPK
jgi:hypothetical protein